MVPKDSSSNGRPAVIFAGGGHAHLYALARAERFTDLGCDVVLVNPTPHLHYSGMATGVVSGTYTAEGGRIDVRRLVEQGGGRFVEGVVERVLPGERTLLLDDGRSLHYDLVSFALGSATPESGLPDGENVVPVKPVEGLKRVRSALSDGARRVLVVGGGAAGCEVAANTAALMRAKGVDGRVTLAHAGPELLSDAPPAARRGVLRHLRKRGVEVLLGSPVASHGDGLALTGDGRELPADLLVRATGVRPSAVFRRSGLATGDDGGLWVNHYLQGVDDQHLFGGGDCVCFRGETLPRLGVYAIREGPVLYRNLMATLRGETLEAFEPQKRYLYVLNLGDGKGLAIYGWFSWRGRAAMVVKNILDKKFVAQYEVGG